MRELNLVKHWQKSLSRNLAFAVSALMFAGCATKSVPTPPVQPPAIPSPPVESAPSTSETWLPKAQNFSSKVQDYLQRVRQITTGEQPK
jgi:uncharacterized lipoprotein YajG